MPILTVFKFVIAVALILFGCLLWDLNFFLGFIAGSIFGIVGGWFAVPGVIALIILIWIVSSSADSADEKDTDIGLLGLLIGSIAGALISWLVIPLTIVVIFVLWILGFAGEVETIPQPTESKAHELSSDLDRKIDMTLKSTTKPSVSQPSSQQLSSQPLPISEPVSEQPAPQPMIQPKKSTSPKKKVDKRRKIEEERARELKKILNELKDVFQNPYVRKEIWDDIENKRSDNAENKINEIFECLDKYRELEVRIRKLKNKISEFKKTVLAFPIRDNVLNDLLERLYLAKEELDWDELEEIEKCIEKEEKKLRKFEEKLKEKKKKFSKIKREIKRLKEKEKNLNVEYIQGLLDEVETIITKDPNNKLVNLLLYKAELAIEKANQFLDKVSELRNHMEEFKKTYPDIDLGNLYKSLEIVLAEGIVLDKLKAIDESMNQLREFLDDFNKVRYKVGNIVEEDTKTRLFSLCNRIYRPLTGRWNEDVLVGSTSKIKRLGHIVDKIIQINNEIGSIVNRGRMVGATFNFDNEIEQLHSSLENIDLSKEDLGLVYLQNSIDKILHRILDKREDLERIINLREKIREYKEKYPELKSLDIWLKRLEYYSKYPDVIDDTERFVSYMEESIKTLQNVKESIQNLPMPAGEKSIKKFLGGIENFISNYPEIADCVIVRRLNPDVGTLEDKIGFGDLRSTYSIPTKEGVRVLGKSNHSEKIVDLEISEISIREDVLSKNLLKILTIYENLGAKYKVSFFAYANCTKKDLQEKLSKNLYYNPENKISDALADAIWKKLKEFNGKN